MRGLLGFLKKHKYDYSAMRSHVLGDTRQEFIGEPMEESTEMSSASFDRQMGRGKFAREAATQGRDIGFGDEYNPSFEASLEPVTPLEMPGSQAPQGQNNYEVMDRLAFIENQLTAIKAQVELVNERLKNIDAKLGGRRY